MDLQQPLILDIQELLKAVRDQHGAEAYERLLDRVASSVSPHVSRTFPGFSRELLIKNIHDYVTYQECQSRINSTSKTPAVLLRPQVAESWTSILKALSTVSIADFASKLTKKFDEADWKPLKENSVPESESLVTHAAQLSSSPASKPLSDISDASDIVKPMRSPGGRGVKLSYSSPDGSKVMLKPYYKAIEPNTKYHTNLPITGWAAITTNKLFNAAGMKHNVEDVGVEEHQGVPVTVHNLHSKAVPVKDLHISRHTVDPIELKKIAMLDFLTNNRDRHVNNLMAIPKHMSEGHSPLLAIDHERNFQYLLPAGPYHHDSLQGYLSHNSGPKTAHALAPDQENSNMLARWWKEHGPKINEEMTRQLFSVKDPALKEHIAENFKKRYNVIDEWAHTEPDSNPFTAERSVGFDSFPISDLEAVNKITSKLDKDPLTAANQAIELARSEPGSKLPKPLVQDALLHLAQRMTPKQLAKFYQQHESSNDFDIFDILRKRPFHNGADAMAFKAELADREKLSPGSMKRLPILLAHYAPTSKE
jgi:hypothetical protein